MLSEGMPCDRMACWNGSLNVRLIDDCKMRKTVVEEVLKEERWLARRTDFMQEGSRESLRSRIAPALSKLQATNLKSQKQGRQLKLN